MADLGLMRQKLNGLPPELRPIMGEILTDILTNLRFGHPTGESRDPALNFGAGFFAGTTAAVANTEFSIAHNFGRTPYLAIPVLPLDQIGSEIVPLRVTKAADNRRVYLSSSVEGAAVTLFIEG